MTSRPRWSSDEREQLAEGATAWRVTRSLVDDCIELQAADRLDAPTATMAKWWATDQQCRVLDECVQLRSEQLDTDEA